MTTPEDAIRARRRLTNKLIAAHEAARLKPFFAPDIRLIAGDGALILGADAVVAAFASQFADPDFVTYLRTPETVELDAAGERAAEHGRWIADWKGSEMGGTYLAVWKKTLGQWVLESELYVTLS
ncbi:nuclear transport factor 2 family protein [Phenylobacterium sp. LjRoot225]|uniref:YybH family protein n=1 Tax=Phenylobacterium sp. LjRoot225 TaxID=3342285 RepID=UPI003ECE64B8